MIVAGGVYLEICISPPSTSLFGSGGRAALGLVGLSPEIELHAFQPAGASDDVYANFEPTGVRVHLYPSSARVGFRYLFPLAKPAIAPVPLPKAGTITVTGQHVLRFGCLEGDFRIEAAGAVYDPQSSVEPTRFGDNGSRAGKLAVVLNRAELYASSGLNEIDVGAAAILSRDHADVVVVKCGPEGAVVFEAGHRPVSVPAYQTRAIYKVGSGDVFSATFAHYWLENNMAAPEAARLASLHAADYVETRLVPFRSPPPERTPITRRPQSSAAVLGLSGGASANWLYEEATTALIDLGVNVEPICVSDLSAIVRVAERGASTLLILLQSPNHTVEPLIHAARELGLSVIIYSEVSEHENDDAYARAGCRLVSDLTTALYLVAWA